VYIWFIPIASAFLTNIAVFDDAGVVMNVINECISVTLDLSRFGLVASFELAAL